MPALGIVACLALIFTVEKRVLVFFGWYTLGAIVMYFVYGMHNSQLHKGQGALAGTRIAGVQGRRRGRLMARRCQSQRDGQTRLRPGFSCPRSRHPDRNEDSLNSRHDRSPALRRRAL